MFGKVPKGSKKSSVNEFLFSKLQAYELQPLALLAFNSKKLWKKMSATEFSFAEGDANRFSGMPAGVPQKDSIMGVLLERFQKLLEQLFF